MKPPRSRLLPFPILVLVMAAAIIVGSRLPARSSLVEFTRGAPCGPSTGNSPSGSCPDQWNFGAGAFALQWRLNPTTGANISGSRSAEQVIQAAFATWLSAPNTALAVSEGATSSATAPNSSDGVNVIAFVCSSTFTCDFAREPQTLAFTVTTTANTVGQPDFHGGATRFVGQILDADTFFNPNTTFTTEVGGSSDPNTQDLQTIATHEIGHFFGLDHTAVVRAVMFPFAAQPSQVNLSYDDVAGISALYPKATPDVATGAIAGAVTLNGSPVFGAHVFAESATAAPGFASFPNIRKSPISTLTLPDGTFRITGLPPDSYTVSAEPLDQPVTAADVQFYPMAFLGDPAIQTGFTTRWH